jgi:hypothetical protein
MCKLNAKSRAKFASVNTPLERGLVSDSTRVGSILACKYWIMVDITDRDEHYSLFQYVINIVNYDSKNVLDTGIWWARDVFKRNNIVRENCRMLKAKLSTLIKMAISISLW